MREGWRKKGARCFPQFTAAAALSSRCGGGGGGVGEGGAGARVISCGRHDEVEGLALQTLSVVCCVLLDLYCSLSAIMSHNVLLTVSITPTYLSFSLGMFFFFIAKAVSYKIEPKRCFIEHATPPPTLPSALLFFEFFPPCHASLQPRNWHFALTPPFHWTSGQTVTPCQSDMKSLPINGHLPSDSLPAPLLLSCRVSRSVQRAAFQAPKSPPAS
jgi:hypothetical protein